MRQVDDFWFDLLTGTALVAIVMLLVMLQVQHNRIKYYERAFSEISNDMRINYALHQGSLEKLKECK